MSIIDSPNCGFCNSEPETLCHLFVTCSKTVELWNNIKIWVRRSIGFHINIIDYTILFGSSENIHRIPLNTLIFTAKYYIFSCSRKEKSLNIFDFQRYLKKIFLEQKHLSLLECQEARFQTQWLDWSNLFDNIH